MTPSAEPAKPTTGRPLPASCAPAAPVLWRRHRLPLLATLPFLPLYAVWGLFLATGGGDLAAQEAWAGFASRHGGSAYNLSWYGGMHTASYSVLSPYLMAAFGVRAVSIVAGLTASWLTALLMARARPRRPLGPALLASLMLWCNVASGRTTFALGVAVGLAACVLLTGGRRVVGAAACAALATMASPVAGLFLAVVGAGFLLVRDWGRALALLASPFAVVATTTLLFPFSGEQLMPPARIVPPALLGLTVVVLAPRTWRVARWSGGVYVAGTVLVCLIPSPVGTNVERFAALFGPAVLLAVLLASPGLTWLRRTTLMLALVLSVGWVGITTVADLEVTTTVPSWATDTHGVVRALQRLGADRTRVEVIPARNHREAAVLAPHVTMARGWNRQLDVERARLFYDGTFSAATYRAWLDHWAVGLVVLPLGEPDGYARDEARLVRDHRPDWLEPVWHDANWRVYRVRGAVPLASAPASVLRTTSTEVTVHMPRPGAVTVRIVYSPWLQADAGCLTRQGQFTRLTVSTPGEYRVSSAYLSALRPDRC